jgi:sulfur-carrier protein
MTIHFYGKLADAFGRSIDLELAEACSVAELRERLSRDYPDVAEILGSGKLRACVDNAIVPASAIVNPDQTIEFLPPVSGG